MIVLITSCNVANCATFVKARATDAFDFHGLRFDAVSSDFALNRDPAIMKPLFAVAANLVTTLVFCCAVAIGLFPTIADATSFVGLIDQRNNRLVMATDGQDIDLMTLGGNAVRETAVRQCKMIVAPNCAVAIVGLHTEDSFHWNAFTAAQQACATKGSIRQKADAFLKIGRPAISAIAASHKADLQQWLTSIHGNSLEDLTVVDAIFGGSDKGHLGYFIRGFLVRPDGEVIAQSKEVNDTSDSWLPSVIAGSDRRISRYARSHKMWKNLDYADAARLFVRQEMKGNPMAVGPPISVLEVRRASSGGTVANWIETGACNQGPK